MAGRKGIGSSRSLRRRRSDRRGGGEAAPLPECGQTTRHVEAYLESLEVRAYRPSTIAGRRKELGHFLGWCAERMLDDPEEITRPVLTSYQRHLFKWRKSNGKPLGATTQRQRLGAVKELFAWLCREDHLPANPASEIQLPRVGKRLPVEALTYAEVAALLAVPDTADPLGIRDRALLELFYSTGIRRGEAAALAVEDLARERSTLVVRQGKGGRDRVVPVGARALSWLERYLEEVRPRLVVDPDERSLLLTGYGEGFHPDVLSRMVSKWMREIDCKGSCHLLRHTCATHLLEGGADIRYIQQLLGHAKLETTALYTEVTIEQLRRVHASCHPAENPIDEQLEKPSDGGSLES